MTNFPSAEDPVLGWFYARRERAFRLVLVRGPRVLGPASRIGGFPFLPEGQDWPRCPKCRMGLFFVGQLGENLPPVPLPPGIDVFCIYKCRMSSFLVFRQFVDDSGNSVANELGIEVDDESKSQIGQAEMRM